MMATGSQNAYKTSAQMKRNERRKSTLFSSDPQTDNSPIDFILVYNNKKKDHKDTENNNGIFATIRDRQRESFEHYLQDVHGLELEHVKSTIDESVYVKIHIPFKVLLSTAEKIRMKLPVEKIYTQRNNSSANTESYWYRFTNWFKKPFCLDAALVKDDIDYYTAVYYSSNIKRFEPLFEGLRGSKDLYFTPTERSLLTYELLSRAHFDDDEDHNQLVPVNQRPALNTVVGLETGLKRPGISRLITKKIYNYSFPLHERLGDDLSDVDDSNLTDREKLKRYWATMRKFFKFQPLSLIRSYMGEKIAFYFALTGFYNQMLILPSIVGFIIFIYGVATFATDQPTSDICGSFGDSTYMCPTCDKLCPFWKLSDSCFYAKISYVFDNTATVVFAILMSLWARWFIEFWKRRQAVLQYEWDSIDFEENLEPIRPEYEDEANKAKSSRINPVTGMKEAHIEMRTRIPYFLVAALALLVTVGFICATLFATIVYRVQMGYIFQNTSVNTYSAILITITSAIMNLIFSILLSEFYYWIAGKLTDLERHKYQTRYDNSLTIKIYLFQFANFYSTLFYIAFFKGKFDGYPSTYGEPSSGNFTEQCNPAGCFVELSIQFFIIMAGKQFASLLVEFFLATWRSLIRACCTRSHQQPRQQWEKDKELEDFQSTTLLDEYLELVIQFGFVTLFVVAFPLAPLFALLNNIIGIRLDAWKFLSKFKRAIPFRASDIGIWEDVIVGVSYLAVVTNAAVIAWSSEFIPRVAYRSLVSTGGSLTGYVNWTLASFSISDYNQTGTMTSAVPTNLTYCRYRDFRESTGPYYAHTSMYWNVAAARLAFMIVFEHTVFFTIYLIQWMIPDVPKDIQVKIAHELYMEQNERWNNKENEEKHRSNYSHRTSNRDDVSKKHTSSPANDDVSSPVQRKIKRIKSIRIKVLPQDTG
ncbi:unnamed protein product [Rotaria socialis]|uniref:Anoctamin n=1 Tax=Rotaria socialis TaxID=392032 RepID=A0A817YV42_9BILA|nr:unnamed protein product [Rotaria socialis]CAF4467023.1 unnamed protein product [Rotaria socialis]